MTTLFQLVASSPNLHEPKLEGDVGYDMELAEDVALGPRTCVNPLHTWARLVRDSEEKGFEQSWWTRFLYRAVCRVFGPPPPPSMAMPSTAIKVAIPQGYWTTMLPRSSTNKRGVMISGSVIDTGYRGELFPILHNMTDRTVIFPQGTRVAQLVVLPATVPHLVLGAVEATTARGLNGFGSTGD